MPAVDVIPAEGVLPVHGQTESGEQLHDPFGHVEGCGVIRFRRTIIGPTRDRHHGHEHGDRSIHVEE